MASMKLILLQDVEDLGLAGEEVHVAPGYGRNYLIPRGFATIASTSALRQLAARKEKIEAQRKADLAAAQDLAKKIASAEIVVAMQASDDNHLFGSVTERVILETLAALGIKIASNRLKLEVQIRTLGEFPFEVKLPQGVIANAVVKVVRA